MSPRVKQVTSGSSMPEAGHPKLVLWDHPRDGVGREAGGGPGGRDTCAPVADSCQYMAKATTTL